MSGTANRYASRLQCTSAAASRSPRYRRSLVLISEVVPENWTGG